MNKSIYVARLKNGRVKVYDENQKLIDTFDNVLEYRDWLFEHCLNCRRLNGQFIARREDED
jgi:hypothetical protein